MPEAFRSHLLSNGYATGDPLIFDGKIRRPKWQGATRSKSATGWYVGFDHGDFKAAAWGDWSDAVSETWTSKSERKLSSADKAEFRRKIAEAQAEADKERLMLQARASRSALKIWSLCELATNDTPYCQKKGIPPDGLRCFGDGSTVAALFDGNFALINLQIIRPDGTKRFLKNGPIVDAHWRAGPIPESDHDGDIIITEGVATAASLRKLTGTTVFAAMNAGNLGSIVKWARTRWPFSRILVAGDDDRWERDGTPRPEARNMGRIKAVAACENTRGLAVFPLFTNPISRGTDWNDLMVEEGTEATLKKWASATTIASLDRRLAGFTETQYQSHKQSMLAAYKTAGLDSKPGVRLIDARRKALRSEDPEAEKEEETPIATIYRLAGQEEFWHDQFKVAYVTYENEGVKQNAPVAGSEFCNWLRMQYEEEMGGGGAPAAKQLYDSAMAQLSARAMVKCDLKHSYVRVAEVDGVHWLDLGRADWLAVRITKDGWTVMEPEVKFIRSDDDAALPLPTAGGSLEPLWSIINVADDDKCLVAGWLMNCLLASAPMYGLNLYGSHGSAKSSASRILRRIIDPSSALTQTLSEKRLDELSLTCRDQWIPIFENVSHLSPEMQDALCRLSTGEADRRRKLYTDDGMCKTFVRRPWIVNGINNVCTRGDLAERSVPIELRVIPSGNRITEHSIEGIFTKNHAGILGCILDAAVAGLRARETVAAWAKEHGVTHRMADAALWITGCESNLGFEMGSFVSRLTSIQEQEGTEALSDHPVVLAINELLEASSRGWWRGTLSALLAEVKPHTTPGKYAVDDAKKLGNFLAREAPRLRASLNIIVSEKKLRRVPGSNQKQYVREIEWIKHDKASPPPAEPATSEFPF